MCLLSSCFIQASAGGYLVNTEEGKKPGLGVGLLLGFYADLDWLRLGVGGGGEGAVANAE